MLYDQDQDQGDADSFVPRGNGYLSLPIKDFSGYCNDNNFVQFENAVQDQSCIRSIAISKEDSLDSFSAQCLNELSIQHYVSKLYIASTP